jgi:hypothetical protein
MGKIRNSYKISVDKTEEMRDLGVDGWIILKWIMKKWDVAQVSQNRVLSWAFVNTVMNFGVHKRRIIDKVSNYKPYEESLTPWRLLTVAEMLSVQLNHVPSLPRCNSFLYKSHVERTSNDVSFDAMYLIQLDGVIK